MKKIITLSILAMIFSLTTVAFAAEPVVEPMFDGNGVGGSIIIPTAEGNGVSGSLLTPITDGSGVGSSTTLPVADGSGVGGSNLPPADGTGVSSSTTLPVADGTGVSGSTSTPVADGSGVGGSNLPPADGSGVGGSTTTTPVVPVTPTPTTGGGGGGSSSGSYYSFSTASASTGSVLGAAVDTDNSAVCGSMFKTYMRKGNKNNKAEVVKLQKFLNEQIGSKLPTTGYFGPLTEKAVRAFQIKYSKAILAPWVEAGLMDSAVSTGYFFKTTQYQANKIICASEIRAFPILK